MKLWCPACAAEFKRPFNLEYGDKFCDEGHPLQHGSARAKQRKPLGPGKRKPRPSLSGFHQAVCDGQSCALEYLGGCSGRPESHHAYPKQRLKGNPAAYTDPRGGVCLCSQHHQQVEWRRVDCPRPPHFDEFLADHGLADPDERSAAA